MNPRLTAGYRVPLDRLYPRRGDTAWPLRRDVRTLGHLLGDAIRAQHGAGTLRIVERLRRLARDYRRGRPGAGARMQAEIRRLPAARLRRVVKSFLVFFELANVAEEHHRVRRRRAHRFVRGEPPQVGSLEDALRKLKRAGIDAGRLKAAIARTRLDLVFTAHPTEILRKTVYSKLRRVDAVLERLDQPGLAAGEVAEALETARDEVRLLLLTDPLRWRPPSPEEEAEMGLWVLEDPLLEALPRVHAEFERALERVYGGTWRVPALIRFRTWVGGDRDGNPNVTAAVTARVLAAMRARAIRLLTARVRALWDELSASSDERRPDPALYASLARDLLELDFERGAEARIVPQELFRRKLWAVHERLRRAGEGAAGGYRSAADLRADLELLRASLERITGPLGRDHRLNRLIRQADLFGLTLVPLELRQHAAVHRRAAAELRARPRRLSAETREVLATVKLLASAPAVYGPGAADTYIVSGCETLRDVLDLLELFAAAGVKPDPARPVRVVPLLESRGALERAEAFCEALWRHRAYRPWLAAAGGVQEVLLGYSDTTKEEGILSATWLLHRVQDRLGRLAAARGVSLVCYHGRGGTPGRGGGGPIHRAIRAMPRAALRSGKLKLTQQGEVITRLYENADLAGRNLEVLLSALLSAQLSPDAAPSPGHVRTVERLVARSRAAYQGLVRRPEILPYLEQASPFAELGRLNVGSRPGMRPGAAGWAGLRAIPLVFAWTQNRHLLQSWFGIGTALAAEDAAAVRALRGWLFWDVFLDFAEMALAKADLGEAAQYAQLAAPAVRDAIWPAVAAELPRTVAAVLRARGARVLLGGQRDLRNSILLRNPYVDVLSRAQVELLRCRARGRLDREGRRTLALTIHGIAAGMRNTG